MGKILTYEKSPTHQFFDTHARKHVPNKRAAFHERLRIAKLERHERRTRKASDQLL